MADLSAPREGHKCPVQTDRLSKSEFLAKRVMSIARAVELSGWGRYPRRLSTVICPEDISQAVPPAAGAMITRGQGRSYGDAALCADGTVMITEQLSRFVAFDEQSGLLTAEAGTTLA